MTDAVRQHICGSIAAFYAGIGKEIGREDLQCIMDCCEKYWGKKSLESKIADALLQKDSINKEALREQIKRTFDYLS